MRETDALKAASRLIRRLDGEGFLLFETEPSQSLARSLVRRAFIEGGIWAIAQVERELPGEAPGPCPPPS